MVPGGGQSLTVSEGEGGGGASKEAGWMRRVGMGAWEEKGGSKRWMKAFVQLNQGILTSPPSAPRHPALLFPSADTLK